jgi:hypothetical protein
VADHQTDNKDASGDMRTRPRAVDGPAKSRSSEPPPRLYFIVAREAPRAVVLSRGPAKQVELLNWDLLSDELTPGQWLKGRIYERKCDLSPNGELLVYFAAKWAARPIEEGSWTAVSRPPFLTALALWFNGDVNGGGGLFDSDRHLRLDHGRTQPSGDFELPDWLRVDLLHDGSHEPIEDMRLRRDGWQRITDWGERPVNRVGKPYGPRFSPPVTYRRSLGPEDCSVTLEMAVEPAGDWGLQTLTRYRLLDGNHEVRDLGTADWADAAPNGDLLLARDGRLFRLSARDPITFRDGELREVADLRGHRFEERIAPAAALRW